MTFYIPIITLLSLFYLYIMWQYRKGWHQLPMWEVPINHTFQTKVSVLIPSRNEEANIAECVQSILHQTYPTALFEIIVIDDFSTDNTASIVQSFTSFNVRLLQLKDYISEEETQSFKKKALEIAIEESNGDLIITTDADCITNKDWLSLIVSYYEKHASKFIAAPVQFHQEQSAFERFQSLDFIGMMVITGGGIHSGIMNMSNGANMTFEKAVFYEVDGYNGVYDKASGDDMMLMEKIAKIYPNKIGYIKNKAASTFTTAQPTIASFFNQRVRWTTKAGDYQERQMTAILGLVWLFCVSIPFSFLSALIFQSHWLLMIGIIQLLLKAIADYLLLRTASQFFDRMDLMRTFTLSSVFHLLYIIAVGFWGNVAGKYEWKGRRVR